MKFKNKFTPVTSVVIVIVAVLCALAFAGWELRQHYDSSRGNSAVVDYQTCVQAGNQVMESYPAVCIAKDKKQFVQPISKPPQPMPHTPQPPSEGVVPR
jgi:predicted negative regulator of RcsB-dependent stress response